MSDRIINTLKLKLVAAELAKIGITDRTKVIAIAERTTVDDTGAIIGLKADGNRGVGSAENCELSIADVARDMGETISDMPSGREASGQVNPFAKGPHFNLTAQIIMLKNDPELAEHMSYLASIGK